MSSTVMPLHWFYPRPLMVVDFESILGALGDCWWEVLFSAEASSWTVLLPARSRAAGAFSAALGGREDWSLGFPMLTWRSWHHEQVYCGALFYWPLRCRSLGGGRFSFERLGPPQFNTEVWDYWQKHLWRDLSPPQPQDPKTWLKFVQELKGLAPPAPPTWQKLQAKTISTRPQLVYAPQLLQAAPPRPPAPKTWPTTLADGLLNAKQTSLAKAFFQGQNIWAYGPSLSGKTHLATALIPALLCNSASVLILAPNTTSFSDWQYHLHKMGLAKVGQLSLENPEQDLLRLEKQWQKLQELNKTPAPNPPNENPQFQKLQQELQQAQNLSQGPWSQALAHYLQAETLEKRYWLNRQIPKTDFDFNPQSLQIHQQSLERQAHYYQNLYGRDLSRLQALNPLCQNPNNYPNWLPQLQQASQELQTLAQAYQQFLDDFSAFLWWNHRQHAAQSLDQIQNLLKQFDYAKTKFGPSFADHSWSQIWLEKILGLFKPQWRKQQQERKQWLQNYQQLHQNLYQIGQFPVQMPPKYPIDDLHTLTQTLAQFSLQIQLSLQTLDQQVQTSLQQIQIHYPLHPKFRKTLEQLNQTWQTWLQTWQNLPWLKLNPSPPPPQLQATALHLLDWSAQVQALVRQAQSPLFDEYYQWRYHFEQCPPAIQNLVQTLIAWDIKPQRWQAMFETWYHFQNLHQYYNDALPRQTPDFKQYFQLQQQSQTELRQRAQTLSQIRCQQTLPFVPDLFQNAQAWLNLSRKWLPEQVQACFPLTFAQTQYWEQIFNNYCPWQFDCLIIENAQDLQPQFRQRLYHLARQIIVLSQEAPSPEETKQQQFTSLQLSSLQSKSPQTPKQLLQTPNTPSQLSQILAHYLPSPKPYQLQTQVPLNGHFADFLWTAPQHPPLVGLIDAGLHNLSQGDFAALYLWREQLQQQGYQILDLFSSQWWQQPQQAAQDLEQRLQQQLKKPQKYPV